MAEPGPSNPPHDPHQPCSNSTAATEDESKLRVSREKECGAHGCTHYRRRCKLVAPCCGEVFYCRHCHNEEKQAAEWDPAKRHELVRKEVREVVCALCHTRQPVAPHCCSCSVSFGAWTCMKCKFFDDELTRDQFHCDKCGICRIGGRDNFFHCDTCGCCYSHNLRENHVCVANSMKNDCPVCLEYLFDSVRRAAVLPCGHTVHADCLEEMQKARQLACPLCCKSFQNMRDIWNIMDEEAQSNPMPSEYANWMVDILCNDCLERSRVNFHVVGLRCSSCRSYNTRRTAVPQPGAS